MKRVKFKFPTIEHSFPLPQLFIDSLIIEDPPDIVEWIEKNVSLPKKSSYALKGPVKLDPFQKWPLRYAVNGSTKKFFIVSSVQVGKSFLCELIAFFLIRFYSGNLMLCYQEAQTAARVILERIQPVLKHNPELSRYLTKQITQEYINLTNGVLRFASSEAPRTIASFSVPFIIASEVAKYVDTVHDTEQLLLGRKNFYEKIGEWLFMAESSPMWTDDTFGKMCDAVKLHVYPHVKLTCCGGWLFMDDKHLEVDVDSEGNPIRDVDYIKNNPDCVYLRCPYCNDKVYEKDHYSMLQNVIYAENPGQIINDQQPEYNDEEIVIHWNKLLNAGYTFNACLAQFFYSASQLDGNKALYTYQRESMGRFIKRGEIGDDVPFTADLQKFKPYTIYTPSKLPKEIKFLIAGHDVHKDRITSVVRGFTGNSTDTYLINYEEVEHDILEDKQIAFERIRDRIYTREYLSESDKPIPIIRGIIDIADGNTVDLSKFISDRITVNGHKVLKPYRGSTQRNPMLIEWHDKSKCFFGDTVSLSRIVAQLIHSNNWYLPTDTPEIYLKQLMGENEEGKKISDNNHVRSCENYIQAMAYLLQAYNPSGKWNDELMKISAPAESGASKLADLLSDLM